MFDLLIKNGLVVDPKNNLEEILDVGVVDGKISKIGRDLEGAAKKVIDASDCIVIPGIIDMHTHMRTVEGHPHAQRMIALAGVTTTLDMAGPLDNILDTMETSGAGVNIAVLEAARHPVTISSQRPSIEEQRSLIERTLEHGGLGIKLLGGHFPMDLDISASFIDEANKLNAWIAWHAGNSVHGSNILGMEDAVKAADGKFLHLAHINSYCRGQISNELAEAEKAIELLIQNPNIFAESYLSPLNGTRLSIVGDEPASKVTATCLKKVGCTPNKAGMIKAIKESRVGVLADQGTIGKLLYGQEALDYWLSVDTQTTGSFAVNPAVSRFLLAQAKRPDGTFVVDCFSTDGGCYPRNVIVEQGLSLVKFGAITLKEFAIKASLHGAKALGLPNKGHLTVGADADISILNYPMQVAKATVVEGKVIMLDGKLFGKGTTIICDERGKDYLAGRGIKHIVRQGKWER